MSKTPTLHYRFIYFSTLTLLLLSSCTKYYFSMPQPIDAKNIYIFPKQFRGTWVMDGDTLVIEKHFYLMPKHEPRKIIVGSKKVIKRYTQMSFGLTVPTRNSKENSTETSTPIRYIEEVDTSCHFVIKSDKVYEIEKKGLSKGFPSSQKGDTIYYTKIERNPVMLGSNFFLRKISPKQFMLNVREEKENWWTLALLEITADGFIRIKGLGEKFSQHYQKIYSTDNSFYFDSQFTRDQWIDILSKDLFSEEHIKLKIKGKIK